MKKLITGLFILIFFSPAIKAIEVSVDSRISLHTFNLHPNISLIVEGSITELSSGNLVIPTRNAVLTIDANGKLLNHFYDGAHMPPNFQAGATELVDGGFIIGSLKGFYAADANGKLNKKLDHILGHTKANPSVMVDGYGDQKIIIPANVNEYSPSGWQGRLYVLDHNFNIENIMIIPDSHFSKGHSIALKSGKKAIMSSSSLVIFDHDRSQYTKTKLKATEYLYSNFATPTQIANENIVIGVENLLYILDKNGQPISKTTLNGQILNGITEAPNGNLILTTNSGITYFLNKNGDVIKSHRMSERGIGSTPAIIDNDLVAVGSFTGDLFLFNTKGDLLTKYDVPDARALHEQKALKLKNGKIMLMSPKGTQNSELIFLTITK